MSVCVREKEGMGERERENEREREREIGGRESRHNGWTTKKH